MKENIPKESKKIWSFLGYIILVTATVAVLINGFDRWSLWLGVNLVIFSLPLIFSDFIQKVWHRIWETKIGKTITSPFRFIDGKAGALYSDGRRFNAMAYIILGTFFGILSILSLYLFFSSGAGLKDFYSLFISAAILGIISFSLLSPRKQMHFLLGGTIVIVFGFFLINSDTFWGVGLILAGVALALRFFNMTFFNDALFPLFKSKVVKIILKILFWGILITLGLLVFGGIISLIAGLSATTIIIILLILILFK